MKSYEVVIIGAGPAGLQAAIHAARRRHSVLILGKLSASALWQAHIENYFGVAGKVLGSELLEIGLAQAQRFGAEHLAEDVVSIEKTDQGFRLLTETEKTFEAKALILALGVKKKKKIFKEEDSFLGKGVSYCVDCDAWFYREKKVAVVGDGSAALHGAIHLTKFAEKVYLIPLKELAIPEEEAGRFVVIPKKPSAIVGEEEVVGLRFEDGEVIEVQGIFIEIGAKGPLELLSPLGVELDPQSFSYVKVNQRMETSVPGIFACGDLTGPPFQVAKAVGEGCIAALSASDYVKRL